MPGQENKERELSEGAFDADDGTDEVVYLLLYWCCTGVAQVSISIMTHLSRTYLPLITHLSRTNLVQKYYNFSDFARKMEGFFVYVILYIYIVYIYILLTHFYLHMSKKSSTFAVAKVSQTSEVRNR